MMDITISRNGKSAASYFNSSLSKESNYYQEDVPAYWEGETGKHPELDLQGKKVTDKDFHDLVHNINPKTKQRLTALHAKDRRAGYDIGTSAVKSVSILHALTKDSDLFEAHKHANRMMMQTLERDAQAQANTQYGRFYETTSSIIFASYHHFTSRPVEVEVEGKAIHVSDMQMHTHNYTINATRSVSRDKFLALEMGNIYRLAPYYQSVYHAYFSKRLNELGYAIERTKDAYEIIGVSRSIIEKFSSRRMEILKLAKEKGITDPKTLAKLSLLTRHSKGKSVSKEQLYKFWKARLSTKEFESLFEIKGKYAPKSDPISARLAVQRSLDHFLERNSTVQQKRVLGYALQLGYGELLPEDVENALEQRDDIIRSEEHTISVISTREIQRLENKMVDLAVKGKGQLKPLNTNYTPKRDFLNHGQLETVKTVMGSRDFVTGIQGNAGTGKTTLLQEIADGVKNTRKAMLAIAPSAAAVDVLKKEGFDAHTVAAYLVNPKLQEKVKVGVLLFDEAGLSGVKSMTDVLEAAKAQKARVILSGDIKQLSSPSEAGDAFRILQKDANIKTAHIKENMRQKPKAYRDAVNQIARGRILEGYQSLDKMGAVKEVPEKDQRLKEIADDYLISTSSIRSAIIVSPTHVERNQITNIVRDKLKAKGQIKGKERVFPTLQNLSLTSAEKKDISSYEKGQILRFIRNQKGGFKEGGHYEIVSMDKTLSFNIPNSFMTLFKLKNNNDKN